MFFYIQSSKKRCVFFDQRFRTVHGMVSGSLYKLPAMLRTETVSFMHETLRLRFAFMSSITDKCNLSVFHGSRLMFFYTQSSKKRCVFFDQRFRTVHGMVSSSL